MNKIKTSLKLYGLKHTLLKLVKVALSYITTFHWEKCYMMTRSLDDDIILPQTEFKVRELQINDYDQLWKDSFLNERRQELYKARIDRDDIDGYGVFINGKLAYSTWILYNGIEINGVICKKEGWGLLLDSYCHPNYRGRGLHNYMNIYRLVMMKQRGMKYGCGIVLSFNTPAIKTQYKCGLTIEKTFYTYRFRGKKYCTLKEV